MDPKDFKQELWNSVGPLPESMILYINLLRKELEDAHDNLSFNVATFGCLYELLVDESGEDYCNNLRFLDSIKGEIAALANLDSLDNPLLKIQCPSNNTEKDDTAAPVCNWASEVKCFRPGLSPVQCQHKNCTKPIHHLCQIAWETMNGINKAGCLSYCRQHNKFWRDHQASKTLESLPGAQQINHAGGAVIEPANAAGGDKEGEQPRSMAPGG
jgi:hypothetical protein